MGDIVLGIVLQYMVSASFSWLVKGSAVSYSVYRVSVIVVSDVIQLYLYLYYNTGQQCFRLWANEFQ